MKNYGYVADNGWLEEKAFIYDTNFVYLTRDE